MSLKSTVLTVFCCHLVFIMLTTTPIAAQTGLTVTDDGMVGIGTTAPAADLHVQADEGTAGTRIMAVLENNGGTRFDMIDNANTVTWVIQNQSTLLAITKAGTGVRELEIDGSGNLVVTGDITSGGTTYVPDYVFEPDYELLPIESLATFVETERHLPGVPSQAEVLEQGGVNLSQMQMHLLEKIEELTLYTLAQQEQINELERRLAATSQQAAALQAAVTR